jgi:hypothetical protein
MDEGRLVGLMNIETLNRIPREEWHNTSVQAAMLPRERIVWTSAGQPLLPLLERMVADDVHQVPVMNDGSSFAEVVGREVAGPWHPNHGPRPLNSPIRA